MSAHQLPALTLLGAFTVTAAAAWAAAGRRRGAPTIAGALFVLQGALHLLFSLAGSRAGDTGHPATAPQATTAMHGMDGMHAMHGTAGADGAAGPAGPHDLGATTAMFMDMSTGMLAAHLLAALLCGLWLAHGEAAFFTLARAALAYAFTPLRLLLARAQVPDAPGRPVRRARRSAHRPHTVVLAHTLSRRGPPRLSAPRATTLGAHV
ncbi:hypothetical protein MBT42_27275 [Streptomyces sp. MBT42]|uniref:hypothetical protein n=1 Tax=Streptomyces sp. MBT42 TaxID=1488373 RepID=UPI001E2A5A7E|nr:hypothetical protein [Streptomyces sp. MBT42]MCD2467242.1 hypothetical protein [Streptomyces sp. MBT42]